MKDLFSDYTPIKPDEPMNGTEFWAWLDSFKEPPSIFVDALKQYLGKNGFDINIHRIDSDQLNTHKTVFSHFWWCQFHLSNGRYHKKWKENKESINSTISNTKSY